MKTSRKYKIVGLSFDHMHMGDLLRQASECPNAEIAGIFDANPANADAVRDAMEKFAIPAERVFTDLGECMRATEPDLAILCPSTARHADVVEEAAPFGADLLIEKPFAASLADADRMIAASRAAGTRLFINWPLAWYPPHVTTKRLIDEGLIGEVLEIHYYDGNRGPTHHRSDKVEVSEEESLRLMSSSWWYKKAEGGGSLLDYMGYGVTLGTWFMAGRKPQDVTCTTWGRPALEVDEHALCALRYETGMSKFETRWGTFTDPWITQPQPKCGFVIRGEKGTIASYDYANVVTVQTTGRPEAHDIPVDTLPPGKRFPIEHALDVMENGGPIHGPLTIEIARIGQQIVDTAVLSAREGRTVPLLEG